MKEVTIIMTDKSIESQMMTVLIRHLESHGIQVKKNIAGGNYQALWESSSNLITWGMKWKSSDYSRGGRNVLYLENALIKQISGVYVDHLGYFSDSSISVENHIIPSDQEKEELTDFLWRSFGWDYSIDTYNPDGPIVVPLQMNRDAPMLHHFPLSAGNEDRKKKFLEFLRDNLPKGRDVVIRPHPKEQTVPEIDSWPDNWEIRIKDNLYELLKQCSAVVTVNSTVATEALGLRMPVATFGSGAFTGSGVTLDCSSNPEVVGGVLDFVPDEYNVMKYLTSVMRHHLPYSGVNVENKVLTNKSIEIFMNRMVSKPMKISSDSRMTVCIYCGCVVEKACCGNKGCKKCGRINF